MPRGTLMHTPTLPPSFGYNSKLLFKEDRCDPANYRRTVTHTYTFFLQGDQQGERQSSTQDLVRSHGGSTSGKIKESFVDIILLFDTEKVDDGRYIITSCDLTKYEDVPRKASEWTPETIVRCFAETYSPLDEAGAGTDRAQPFVCFKLVLDARWMQKCIDAKRFLGEADDYGGCRIRAEYPRQVERTLVHLLDLFGLERSIMSGKFTVTIANPSRAESPDIEIDVTSIRPRPGGTGAKSKRPVVHADQTTTPIDIVRPVYRNETARNRTLVDIQPRPIGVSAISSSNISSSANETIDSLNPKTPPRKRTKTTETTSEPLNHSSLVMEESAASAYLALLVSRPLDRIAIQDMVARITASPDSFGTNKRKFLDSLDATMPAKKRYSALFNSYRVVLESYLASLELKTVNKPTIPSKKILAPPPLPRPEHLDRTHIYSRSGPIKRPRDDDVHVSDPPTGLAATLELCTIRGRSDETVKTEKRKRAAGPQLAPFPLFDET